MIRLARLSPSVFVMVMACSKQEPPPAAPPGPPALVSVSASDYAFQMPDTLTSGPTTFTLANTGAELHHLQIIRLEQGKTAADLAALEPGTSAPWVVLVGGPNPAEPGREVVATADLAPGNYVAICFIPTPPPGDMKPHFMKGMMRPFTVVPATDTRAMPEAHFTITLRDFDFDFSAPIPAGEHEIKVANAGPQEHEVVIMKLEPGKKPQDVIDWFFAGSKEPPPGHAVGGIAGLSPNQEGVIRVNLTPGEYALYCFVEDPSKKMHTELGMMKQITVQ